MLFREDDKRMRSERERERAWRARERDGQRETKKRRQTKKKVKKSRKLPTGTDEHTIELVFTRKKTRKKESARKRTRIYGE
jgi:response regulator of citrate/malate metabolism